MKIPLSNRLLACCGYVKPGDRVADVGCDHGYLGIYLLKNGIAGAVIASDVREMPLQSAIRNAEKFGVKERMAFCLSDGIRNVPREFDCMVCAGMGADTMISILDAAPWLKGRRLGLITSTSGVTRMLTSGIDAIHAQFPLTALFGPEHGVRGDHDAWKPTPIPPPDCRCTACTARIPST